MRRRTPQTTEPPGPPDDRALPVCRLAGDPAGGCERCGDVAAYAQAAERYLDELLAWEQRTGQAPADQRAEVDVPVCHRQW